ncbi:hypothetical protein C2E20_8857 isoform B [Micractinium conductrix]|uniref:SHSP domain-containing protein n=1 Tax=Micractinium conductrix TaxID=554055 RepID=A0A2P6V053_9CHLO|nr:hypothetical protein C2E20_8857 isoform A [Micractinium conductrix]PSC67476.1 hypothetical protein C2E20_8857 isoform B [Micractinium conductrix]|eukprot:PSC67475.1 hypothetical protein C2E20_8857 isoform A [Micractinium conductrix]
MATGLYPFGGMYPGAHLEDFFSPYFSGWPYSVSPSAGAAGAGAGVGAGGGSGAPTLAGPDVGAGASADAGTTGTAPPYTRAIPVDFIERENEYILRADIPGVHKTEIRVSMDGNVIRFGHQPHTDREQKDEDEPGIFHRAERVSSFRGRALRLPDNADVQAQVNAKYEDGVLELRIPKKKMEASAPQGRVIQIA